jgi:hypothetical protein
MLIAYPYIPAIHDLWLYQDHEITWTVPSSGNLVVKRPYAWNPNSLLYGYRKSIQAMPAVYRTMQTPFQTPQPASYGSNSSADPVNRPVFWNSYVPWKSYAFGTRTMIQSAHWQSSFTLRNASANFENQYTAGSYFLASTLVRWISHDNIVYDLSPSNIIWPYTNVSSAYGSGFASGALISADCAITECTQDIPVPPFALIDARTVPVGTKAFTCDSNFKIIELNWRSCWYNEEGTDRYQFNTSAKLPVGTTLPVVNYLHDSGSTVFVEIKPPTSAAAGDGILGLVMFSLRSANDLVNGTATDMALIPPSTHASNSAVLYQQSLGNNFPMVQPYQRQTSSPIASETVAQQILTTVQLVN